MKDLAYYSHPIFDDSLLQSLVGNEFHARSANKSLNVLDKAGKAALELDFPAAKSDAWRWTDFSELGPQAFTRLAAPNAKFTFKGSAKGLVFTDFNHAVLEHSNLLDRYLGTVLSLNADRFKAMAAAYASQGFLLYVPQGQELNEPLEVGIETRSDGLHFSHSLVVLEADSKCTLVIHKKGRGSAENLSIENLEILLGSNASLDLIELTDKGLHAAAISHEKAKLRENSTFKWVYGHLGEGNAKHFLDVDLTAEHAQARLRGFYFNGSGEKLDLDTQVNHFAPRSQSDLLFKGAANGSGKVTWEGMIYVDPLAMGTDAYQSNRNLALSPQAEIHSIPGLEICADDVQCSHGATVGRIDEEELFYLGTRGIARAEAEKLIVNGFFAEIIDEVNDPKIREQLSARINEKLFAA
ncbi:MAG: Fe-S cluster assembly protein SufD [Anaerolineaceae bacterium]|nr:Fe-S cluster assembly protein SufD [Anaerolineaceae bacterium]